MLLILLPPDELQTEVNSATLLRLGEQLPGDSPFFQAEDQIIKLRIDLHLSSPPFCSSSSTSHDCSLLICR